MRSGVKKPQNVLFLKNGTDKNQNTPPLNVTPLNLFHICLNIPQMQKNLDKWSHNKIRRNHHKALKTNPCWFITFFSTKTHTQKKQQQNRKKRHRKLIFISFFPRIFMFLYDKQQKFLLHPRHINFATWFVQKMAKNRNKLCEYGVKVDENKEELKWYSLIWW